MSNRRLYTPQEVLQRFSDGPSTGVFTDGGASPNPGPGGWGVVHVVNGDIVAERFGHEADTTNNRMELTALITAFELLPSDAEITVYSDSDLCVKTINEWAPKWRANGWRKKGGEIKNLELVKRLLDLFEKHPKVSLKWIKAHDGSRWNEYADALATSWMRM
ncbi:MAG: ribonuclease HI [Bdellovibrionales bacterium]|nr:ribonuclease HI [Bdellovibrionales bacterium]